MKDGKVESFKEAVALLVTHARCQGQRCETCPLNVDDSGVKGKGSRCSTNKQKVTDFLAEFHGFKKSEEPAATAYDFVMSLDLDFEKPKREQEKKAKGDTSPCKGTCKTCLHSAMHSSGIRFCKSFHNFVHEEGFCYRWESDKIEKAKAILDTEPTSAWGIPF